MKESDNVYFIKYRLGLFNDSFPPVVISRFTRWTSAKFFSISMHESRKRFQPLWVVRVTRVCRKWIPYDIFRADFWQESCGTFDFTSWFVLLLTQHLILFVNKTNRCITFSVEADPLYYVSRNIFLSINTTE